MPANSPRPDRRLATVLAAALAAFAGSLGAAHAEDPAKGKEKCFGVAKAGENGCQTISGSHTCGSSSKTDYRGEDWKWVSSGTCLQMGGKLQPFEGFGKQAEAKSEPKKP